MRNPRSACVSPSPSLTARVRSYAKTISAEDLAKILRPLIARLRRASVEGTLLQATTASVFFVLKAFLHAAADAEELRAAVLADLKQARCPGRFASLSSPISVLPGSLYDRPCHREFVTAFSLLCRS